MKSPRTARVRAPQLHGAGGWINTDHNLTLADLRGRVVLLDFWTSACANCLHVIDELRPLEERFGDELVVIGVHSPKFSHETEHATVLAAVRRNAITHPVLDDPQLETWRQYAVKAWPTLVLIDPAGYVVAQAAGEGQVSGLAAIIPELVERRDGDGWPRRGPLSAAQPPSGSDPAPATRTLRYPAKLVAVPTERGGGSSSVLVADAGNHSVVELELNPGGDTGAEPLERRRFGSGQRGRDDGAADEASFAEPNGLALLPVEVAARVGYDVVVADTVNHRLRGIQLSDGRVSTVANLAGRGLRTITGLVADVVSPWDVVWWPELGRLVVAAAGLHLLLSVDPDDGAVEILAGTTVEGLRDGPALDGWLAQPSGLAVDGDSVWFVDAETSALRRLDRHGRLHTAVGEGLFDFGHVDGPAGQARLQHPLGVTRLQDGTVAVLDTYNGAVRRYDPVADVVSTLATGLSEPSSAVELNGRLWVIESAAHRVTAIEPGSGHAMLSASQPTRRPINDVGPGALTLRVVFVPAPGRKVDASDGPGTRLDVSASPADLVVDGSGAGAEFVRPLRLTGDPGVTGVLHVSAQAATCDDDPAAPHPACYLSRQDWGVPIRVIDGGANELELVLLG